MDTSLHLIPTSSLEKVFADEAPVAVMWSQEKGILTEINWYNILIKALNGDIKGLTGEIDRKSVV